MSLRKLLLEVYHIEGPREGRMSLNGLAVVPPEDYAKLTPQEVDMKWDFPNRHLMHRIAQALT